MFEIFSGAAEPKNHSDRVYAFLTEKIRQRFWPANGKIMTENELCAALNVSRGAVREAVERLVALGLLVKKQGSGTFVADPEADSCFNFLFPMILLDEDNTCLMLEFRSYFDTANVKLFMKHHEPADILALERNFESMLANRQLDPELSGNLDCEFHQIIAEGTKNPFIIKISKILTGILRSHQAELYRTADWSNAYNYHGDIINSIRKGDGKVAAALMRKHIKISTRAFKRHLKAKRRAAAEKAGN
ncbi:MAG: FCD domain-containing protein [Planctomycetota bacterium]|nr:FCD domain-containing protein [Planctomycetota bacterium]